METRQGNMLQALRGVQNFLDSHADRLAGVAGPGARQKFDAVMAKLTEHVATQGTSDLLSKGTTQRQHALRRTLVYGHMAPIARIAATELSGTPELEPFRMPSGKSSTSNVYAWAIGMANAAEQHANVFIEGGMRPDFVERLRAAAEAMLATLDARTESRGARSGATTGLCTGISKARKHVRVLDAFVRHALQNDPALLTEWDTVKRPPAKTGKAGRRGPDVAEVATPNVEAPAAPEPALQLVAA